MYNKSKFIESATCRNNISLNPEILISGGEEVVRTKQCCWLKKHYHGSCLI